MTHRGDGRRRPRRKQYLVDRLYSAYSHEPDNARQREERYGDHASLLRDMPREAPKDEAWRSLPSVQQAIDLTKTRA